MLGFGRRCSPMVVNGPSILMNFCYILRDPLIIRYMF